ncbi:hypothetical protein BV22DRAFT_568018, partial [Leucogyrophana mollusca]
MEASPPVFGYHIFATLDLSSSACNSGGAITLPLHDRLVSSGDLLFPISFSLCGVAIPLSLDNAWGP